MSILLPIDGSDYTKRMLAYLAAHEDCSAPNTATRCSLWFRAFLPGPAESKASLIVMGSHGHSALGNLVLGSVVTAVLALCKVPVLLIR